MNNKQNYLDQLVGSYLDGFGIVDQFVELKFSSNKYEEIKFFVDCEIKSRDNDINVHKLFFDNIDEDVSSIIFFIKANRQKVIYYELSDKKFSLIFSNDYILDFDLESNPDEPLSITFKEKISVNKIEKVNF